MTPATRTPRRRSSFLVLPFAVPLAPSLWVLCAAGALLGSGCDQSVGGTALPGPDPAAGSSLDGAASTVGQSLSLDLGLGSTSTPPVLAGQATVLGLVGKGAAFSVVALRPDGRILVAGVLTSPSDQILLARFLPDGRIDASFGAGTGSVSTGISLNAQAQPSLAHAVVVQPGDGKIVVAGHALTYMAVARYSADGVLDASFGAAGIVTLDVNPNFAYPNTESSDNASALALQPDGKIVVAGSAGVYHAQAGGTYWSDFALFRLNGDGSRDASFGKNAVVTTVFESSAFVSSVLVLGDGRIVAGGFAYSKGSNSFALARYLPSGLPDPTLGGSGVVSSDLGGDDRAHAMALLPDGKYLLAGETTPIASDMGMLPDMGSAPSAFAVARFDQSGALDPAFGDHGVTITKFPAGKSIGAGIALTDGGFLVAGAAAGADGYLEFALAAYHLDGSLDRCAGAGGLLTQAILPSTDSVANAIALQPDGTPVLAGRSGTTLALMRIKGSIFRHPGNCLP